MHWKLQGHRTRCALAVTMVALAWSIAAVSGLADVLGDLTRPIRGRPMRASSGEFDPESNRDAHHVRAGQRFILADLDGPGEVRHIWFTIASLDRRYPRTLVLRIFYGGATTPSVETPIGDPIDGHTQTIGVTSAVGPVVEIGKGRAVVRVEAVGRSPYSTGYRAGLDALDGSAVAAVGDPMKVAYIRSAGKPLQALTLIALGGAEQYGLTPAEIAIVCASHSGGDLQVATVRSVLAKAGVPEQALKAGSGIRDNCSGKHAGMLALAKMLGHPLSSYRATDHPIQEAILKTVSEMCAHAAVPALPDYCSASSTSSIAQISGCASGAADVLPGTSSMTI